MYALKIIQLSMTELDYVSIPTACLLETQVELEAE
jgi:hypothetical protein